MLLPMPDISKNKDFYTNSRGSDKSLVIGRYHNEYDYQTSAWKTKIDPIFPARRNFTTVARKT